MATEKSDADVNAVANLESMYEQNLADIPDLPGFPIPHPGVYRLEVVEQGLKDIGDSKAHEFKYKVLEVMEVGDESKGEDCIPGDMFSQLYFMTSEKSIAFNFGRIKNLVAPIAERFGTKSVRESCEKFVGCEIQAIVKLRQNAKNKEQFFPEIEEYELV